MASDFKVIKNRYFDSVFLMRVAQRISDEQGIDEAAALMATENNKHLLSNIGLDTKDPQVQAASPEDLIVVLKGTDQAAIARILEDLDQWLTRPPIKAGSFRARTLEQAIARLPTANLAVISVPGQYAARETKKSLAARRNVFLFSSNVSLEDEASLKRMAHEQGLLLMGPDCGTAIVNGIGIGFANVVRRGQIGAIGVAGTGLQEFTSLVHRCGAGISHALGTGGRDLKDAIGGITTFDALEALEADNQTRVIALIAKPPGKHTLAKLAPRLRRSSKPIVACLLGADPLPEHKPAALHWAGTIDDAVLAAIRLDGSAEPGGLAQAAEQVEQSISSERTRLAEEQRFIRGLFAGGTFCYQSQVVLKTWGLKAYSNTPLPGMTPLADPQQSLEHTLIDMGDDLFTRSRPHPMIDATFRRRRLFSEAYDSQVGVILLDFVLGFNASPDPVGDMLPAIQEAKSIASERGAFLSVVASVCGTEQDPQNLEAQVSALKQAGVIVLPTNAQAAAFAAQVVLPPNGASS
ncbi:MAG: acyl-CoA synthetase FdrA [Anaerolineales bacterium]|jgi:succinyl-CoA synthetase alpha subunit